MKNIFFIAVLLLLVGCSSNSNDSSLEEKKSITTNSINPVKYAKGFTIEQFKSYKVITLKNAWVAEATPFKYVLYKNTKPNNVEGDVFVKTPIKSIACMSLTHVAFLEKLGLENSIIALSGCDYVASSKIKKRIKNGAISEIGVDQNINYEMLVEKLPNFVMGYGIDASSNTYINKLKTLQIDVVLNAEYMELTPLGKAEWIKFVAAFYDEDVKANKIFNQIENEYLELLKITKNVTKNPTVFTGMPWNGAWYVPGAKSFQSQFFKDAGAQYLWLDNDEQASIVKDKEVIINDAFNADFWLNQNSYKSIAEVVEFDNKFKGFSAVKNKQLYNNDKRINSFSGNDYWESGVVNPQIVLKDLIKIFHPNLLAHELYYYRKLE
ncbi:MAG: ABC transporter substrate-binding protein [Vicingaceae bacterium]